MGGSPADRELLECLQLHLGMAATPQLAMAARSGSLPLVLAWALLSQPLMRVDGAAPKEPCEQQMRHRQRAAEAEQAWLSTLAWFSSICAIWILVFYTLHFLWAKKDPCSQETGEGCETPGEGSQEPCAEEDEDCFIACGSQTFACPQPRCGSRNPASSQAQQAYAHQLTSMEQELEDFLSEVRFRRFALGEVASDANFSQNAKWDPDKLRITVYEIADREG